MAAKCQNYDLQLAEAAHRVQQLEARPPQLPSVMDRVTLIEARMEKLELLHTQLSKKIARVDEQVTLLKGAVNKTAETRQKAHSLVVNRVEALEKVLGSFPAASGAPPPTQLELSSLEDKVSDMFSHVTLLGDEVEDLKEKISAPAATPPSPPASPPPAATVVASPADAPAPGMPPAQSAGTDLTSGDSQATGSASTPPAGWHTAGKRKSKGSKGGPNPNRAAWLYVSTSRRQDGKLVYQAKDTNWNRHLSSLLPKGSDLLRGVRKVDNQEDTRLTLACSTRAARAALLAALSTSSSVRVFPHLLSAEKEGRKLAQSIAKRFGVRVVPRGDRCGFALQGAPNPPNLHTFELG